MNKVSVETEIDKVLESAVQQLRTALIELGEVTVQPGRASAGGIRPVRRATMLSAMKSSTARL